MKNGLWMLLPIFMGWLVITSIVSCTDDNTSDDPVNKEDVPWEEYDISKIQVLDSGTISLREVCQNTIAHEMGMNDDIDSVLVGFAAGMIDSITAYEKRVNDSLNAVSGGNDFLEFVLSLSWKTITYESVSADGYPITLSALFVYPDLQAGVSTKPKNYYIGTHVTITDNDECPSSFSKDRFTSDVGMLAVFANVLLNHGYVILPDYEGYGITKDRSHPYLNREVTAKQVIDGAKAGMRQIQVLSEQDEDFQLDENWKAVSVGYSQGGATAAATYRYALDHSVECNSLRMAGAVCGDGPYDPLATLKKYISDNRMYMPVAVALMMKAMCDTDPEMIREGCKVEDFCTPGFVNTGIFKAIEEKTKGTGSIHDLLLKYSYNHDDFTMMRRMTTGSAGMISKDMPYKKQNDDIYVKNGGGWKWEGGPVDSWCEMDQALNADCIAFLKDGTIHNNTLMRKLKALLKCMRRNQLCYGEKGDWIPPSGAKFTFFHSTTDEVVPYVNMSTVRSNWGDSKARYISFYFQPSTLERILGSFKGDKSALKKHWGTHSQCGKVFFLGKARGLADDITCTDWKAGAVEDDGLSALTFIATMFKDL